tara:strand:+ start:6341 stop:6892 length:552 start_codon:yes stop_codon:yes gene_type:complete
MKKYILILFGDVSEEIMLETLSDLEKVSDSIRFFTGPGHGIYHFESKDNATDIKNIITDYLEDTIQSVFIFCLEGDYAIGMDEELRRYFLDAKFGDKDPTKGLNKLKESYIDIIRKTAGDDIEETLGIIPLKELLKRHLGGLPEKTLSVNGVLDKILENGLESLSEAERNFLDNQKKRLNGKK